MHQPKILVDDNRTFLAQARRPGVPSRYDLISDMDGQPVGLVRSDRPRLDAQVPPLDGAFAWERMMEASIGMGTFPLIYFTGDDARQTTDIGSRLGNYLQTPATDESPLATINTLQAGHGCFMSEAG